MKRYLKLYRSYLSLAFKTAIAYRVDAIVGIIGFLISNAVNFFVLVMMISPVSQITVTEGSLTMVWTIDMMMFLYGFLLIPKGIDHMFSDNLWGLANTYVKQGELDPMMTRPVNVLFQLVASNFKIDGLGELILGICFMSIFGPRIEIAWSINNIIPLIICGFLTIFIFFSVKLWASSLAFFFKRSISLMNNIYNMSEFARYPIQLFGKTVAAIFIFIIPFSLGAYLPIQFLIFGGNMWLLTLLVFGVTSVQLIISFTIYRIGLKKYESAGS